MFHFLYVTGLHNSSSSRIKHCTSTVVRFLQTQSLSNDNKTKHTGEQSLTVSYLNKSCGLSLESAISASKMVHIESTEKPDSVLRLLRSHGFSMNHIVTLVSKHPRLILADPEKTLRPKIEFFESLGIVGADLPKIICSDRSILLCSLKNQIIPTFDFLKRYIQTNENLLSALKQSSRVIRCNIEKVMVPNINTLQGHGVSESNIGRLMTVQPRSLMLRVDLFKEVTNRVKEMGFDPKRLSFLLAVRSMSMISKQNWEKKKEALMCYGWSESDFNSAFKLQPMFMLCSEKKIRELMDFFLDKVGLTASDVAKCPNILLVSLERRAIPRCSVLQVLMSEGLIGKGINVVWVLNKAKKVFESNYVTKYKVVAPTVVRAYQGRIGFQGFSSGL